MRILVNSGERILDAAVRHLLSAENDVELIEFPAENLCCLQNAVSHFEPDAVIFTHPTSPKDQMKIREMMEQHPSVQMISLSLEDNWLVILQEPENPMMNLSERKVLIQKCMDLADILRSIYAESRG